MTVPDTLYVVMGQQVAASITRKRGKLDLAYDPAYSRAATPLSVSMPVTGERYGHAVVAPWLDGLLPDSEPVRRQWGRRFSVSAGSPFALLSTPIGEECAGAARFVTAERLEPMLAGKGNVQWLNDAQVATRLRELRDDATTWLGNEFTGRFSLAGAQAKTALLYDEEGDRWGIPQGAAATSHILKPAIVGFDEHDLNEHLCLRAAALSGLVAATSRVVRFEETSAIAVDRYDRTAGHPWLTRIHQEDLCQALGLPPESKYQNEGGPSSTDVTNLLRSVLPADQAQAGVWRLFDALTFNWLIAGTDAHAKNYSLLLSGQQVALAPLYDVASALPYKVSLRKLRMAMKFGGEYLLQARSDSMWGKVATELSLPLDEVRSRALQLMAAVPLSFYVAAADPQVSALGSDLPERLADAVAERVDGYAKHLLGI